MISFNNIGNLGRLANQMFQYASLKGIARNRGYEFSIPPEQVFGQNDPLVKTSPLNIYNVFENISKNNIQISKNPILQERMHEFDEELLGLVLIMLTCLVIINHQNILNTLKMKLRMILNFLTK